VSALVVYRDEDRLEPYRRALEAAGVAALYSSPDEKLAMESFSGLVLTGGTDVNPALFGETPGAETDPPDQERDRCEIALLDQAMNMDLPVLGICRGMQMLNVHHGGSLAQHLDNTDTHRRRTPDKSEPAHRVQIEHESLLFSVCGTTRCDVNSRHHQAVDRLGRNLRISARAHDGVIEALERPDKRFVLAVQWHPEDQVVRFPEQLNIFRRFGAALQK
jgi:gamma-glutamyl-gamma-aminobutyrate hydrolase PuuD